MLHLASQSVKLTSTINNLYGVSQAMNSKAPPLYLTIAETIKARITAGQYKPGHRIPPIRQLAEDFGVNKLTVQKAFERLKREELIENRVGSGSYVRFPQIIQIPSSMFDFRTDYLSESFFPYQDAQRLFNTIFETEKEQSLAPAPVEGDRELLHVLSRFYRLPADRMLMISGAQQGLDLVSKVFATKISESIMFEDPTYPGAISLFKARHFVPMAGDGPDMDEFDRQLSDQIRLFYTMPAVHNPTGIAYSMQKKEAVVKRARRHPFYIIEDDYLGELEPPSSRFIDIAPQQTIHIKSFAQTTSAGIRLGFMVVPADLYPSFIYAKFSSDIASFGLLQKFLREFIKKGYYARHIASIRHIAASRRSQLYALLSQYPFLSLGSAQSGYSVWVEAAIKVDGFPNMPWCPGKEFSFTVGGKNFFRLSFMNLDHKAFDLSLLYLQNLLDRF